MPSSPTSSQFQDVQVRPNSNLTVQASLVMQDSMCRARLLREAIPIHILMATQRFLMSIEDWHPLRNCHTLWFVKQPCCCSYAYSKYNIPCLPFSPILQSIADHIEKTLDVVDLNSVNANYYSNAKSTIGFHSDNEFLFQASKQASCIVSVSLGSTRKFVIKHKTTGVEKVVKLAHGDMLTMEGLMQRFYEHCILEADAPVGFRINLTFRTIVAHTAGCPLSAQS